MTNVYDHLISVIIPTYNRPDRLARLLTSLASQTLANDTYEVIVVDDGSSVDYSHVLEQQWPFKISYFRQENRGATAARNNGVRHSSGRVLIFIDDDITPYPATLKYLVDGVLQRSHTIILGTLDIPEEIIAKSHFARSSDQSDPQPEINELHFTYCMTGLLAICLEDFCDLGGFQDPTGGWPNWDDVDFGYRAHQRGMKLIRLAKAKADHWDYATVDLHNACRRWEAASSSAPRLFKLYPELFPEMPMFHDKGPIVLSSDSAKIAVRKVSRQVISSTPIHPMLKMFTRLLEKIYPHPNLLRPLYRWVVGAHIYRGFRRGLMEMNDKNPGMPPPVNSE